MLALLLVLLRSDAARTSPEVLLRRSTGCCRGCIGCIRGGGGRAGKRRTLGAKHRLEERRLEQLVRLATLVRIGLEASLEERKRVCAELREALPQRIGLLLPWEAKLVQGRPGLDHAHVPIA